MKRSDPNYSRQYYLDNKERLLAYQAKRYREEAPIPRVRLSMAEVRSRKSTAWRNLPQETRSARGRVAVLQKFHTTEEWWSDKWEEQDCHCALCPRVAEANGNRLAIDHDHRCCKYSGSCGKCLRGILCRECNRKIGCLEELLNEVQSIIPKQDSWTEHALQYRRAYELRSVV
jgi:hypothetical protein